MRDTATVDELVLQMVDEMANWKAVRWVDEWVVLSADVLVGVRVVKLVASKEYLMVVVWGMSWVD